MRFDSCQFLSFKGTSIKIFASHRSISKNLMLLKVKINQIPSLRSKLNINIALDEQDNPDLTHIKWL